MALVSLLVLSCPAGDLSEGTGYGTPPDVEIGNGLTSLSARKIFFGHQSVGRNILEGLEEISANAGDAALRINEARTGDAIVGPGIYHAEVGVNTDPISKLRDFEAIMRSGVGPSVDAAMLKFCYVDFDVGADVEALFEAYRDAMARLEAEFPELVIVHCTVPLTVEEYGLGDRIKRILGKASDGDSGNAVREAFSRRLRSEYTGKAPVFDLAMIEASDSTGLVTMPSDSSAGTIALRPEYSDDGGHLNETGRTRVAGWLALELGRLFR